MLFVDFFLVLVVMYDSDMYFVIMVLFVMNYEDDMLAMLDWEDEARHFLCGTNF